MAQRAGLTVTNPQDFSARLVTLEFDQIPAERALQPMANIDGKQAVFHARQVRFDSKQANARVFHGGVASAAMFFVVAPGQEQRG